MIRSDNFGGWVRVCDACIKLPPWHGACKTIGVPDTGPCPICGAENPTNPARHNDVHATIELRMELAIVEQSIACGSFQADPLSTQSAPPRDVATPERVKAHILNAVYAVAARFGLSDEARADMERTALGGIRIRIGATDEEYVGEAGLDRLNMHLRERMGCR